MSLDISDRYKRLVSQLEVLPVADKKAVLSQLSRKERAGLRHQQKSFKKGKLSTDSRVEERREKTAKSTYSGWLEKHISDITKDHGERSNPSITEATRALLMRVTGKGAPVNADTTHRASSDSDPHTTYPEGDHRSAREVLG